MSVTVEGRRIDTGLSCQRFKDDCGAAWRLSAAVGSERLRHAILATMGVDPGPFMLPPPPVVISVPRKRDVIDVGEPRSPVGNIQETVADYYKMPLLHMKSAQRGKKIARPRQIAMYLAAERTTFSLVNIGKMFGKRDHTTVIHAIRVVAERMDSDPQVAADIAAIREALAA